MLTSSISRVWLQASMCLAPTVKSSFFEIYFFQRSYFDDILKLHSLSFLLSFHLVKRREDISFEIFQMECLLSFPSCEKERRHSIWKIPNVLIKIECFDELCSIRMFLFAFFVVCLCEELLRKQRMKYRIMYKSWGSI